MNKHTFFLFLAIIITSCSNAQGNSDIPLPSGKSIYIPKELQGMDLQNPASQWSYHRMAYTENFIIFWEKGFGNDLSNPPQLEGHSMKVDLPGLKEKLENFYAYFYHTLQFARQGSKCDKYRMMVMINYSLEGTAYGGDYDGQIGALWITPNRVQDEKLNCIAHELGHSFQSQITCDGQGEAWGGCGFFEMTSQWMLWQVNPDWMTDEKYHWDAFKTLTHKAYLHLDNIYHSPYVLEYWGIRYGLPFIAELYRQGKRGEDPVITYKRLNSLGTGLHPKTVLRIMVSTQFPSPFPSREVPWKWSSLGRQVGRVTIPSTRRKPAGDTVLSLSLGKENPFTEKWETTRKEW